MALYELHGYEIGDRLRYPNGDKAVVYKLKGDYLILQVGKDELEVRVRWDFADQYLQRTNQAPKENP